MINILLWPVNDTSQRHCMVTKTQYLYSSHQGKSKHEQHADIWSFLFPFYLKLLIRIMYNLCGWQCTINVTLSTTKAQIYEIHYYNISAWISTNYIYETFGTSKHILEEVLSLNFTVVVWVSFTGFSNMINQFKDKSNFQQMFSKFFH